MKPHPFLNAATPGYPRACLNIAGLALLLAGTGAGFIAAGATCPPPFERLFAGQNPVHQLAHRRDEPV